MKAAIIGREGRIGRVISDILQNNGVEIDDDADLAFLCVPIRPAIDYIEKGGHTYVEVSSVKSAFKRFAGSIVSIHPLFGPSSYRDGMHRTIVFINDISNVKYKEIIEEMFRGYEIVSMSAEEHDRMMVNDMIIPYLMSMIAKRTDAKYRTRSFDLMKSLASIVDGENQEVLMDTIKLNPYAGVARETIEEILEVIS
ncbi:MULTISPECIES: prephenate dehydrogenase/arogenate dehydrogenase family protein [unclassified Thermoplasma]|uniref:prephenate dehydrogenase/arogenate dehydrogenase family protein n=1 Tax=unclassified Thermoplasma TaxID=2684908 RepID=UPI000D984F52|nr:MULTISPECIES: prephenate dehydrogenase/arogenate dehydrogenase family protein [unclassified Thermoplasma]PYB68961.1 hypothetical protein DMB44_01280 [Thermoplasma sp. Kam2015]